MSIKILRLVYTYTVQPTKRYANVLICGVYSLSCNWKNEIRTLHSGWHERNKVGLTNIYTLSPG